MQIEITEQEREYLRELLKFAHSELLHELHHTDAAAYKKTLKEKTGMVETLQKKLETVPA